MNLVLDINCELFPSKYKVNFILTKSIKTDGSATSSAAATYNPNEGPSLADKFEYVCYGQVYKLEEIPTENCKHIKIMLIYLNFYFYRALHVSFGGLIFRIENNSRYLTDVTNGSFIS